VFASSVILPSEFPLELDSRFKKIMPFLSLRKDLLPGLPFSISSFQGIEKVSLSAENFPSIHPSVRSAGEPSFLRNSVEFFSFLEYGNGWLKNDEASKKTKEEY
jgi:hypothetical protein